MSAQPDLLASTKGQELPALIKPTRAVQIVLSVWMTAVLVFYLLTYTPPFIWTVAGKVGLRNALSDLQAQIRPFFQTTDFSDYIYEYFLNQAGDS
jgi:hypothetical protein